MDQQLYDDLRTIGYRMYGGLLPKNIRSSAFTYFVTKADTLAASVWRSTTRRVPPKFVFQASTPSAFTDGQDIYMPTSYLLESFYDMLGIDYNVIPEAAIICINGSQIHEALHLVHTVFDAADNFRRSILAAEHADYFGEIWDIANVLEDLYIESSTTATHNLTYLAKRILILKNSVLFNEALLEKSLYLYEEEPSVKTITQLLVFYKRKEMIPIIEEVLHERGEHEIVRMMSDYAQRITVSTYTGPLERTMGRIIYAYDIWKYLHVDRGLPSSAGESLSDLVSQLLAAMGRSDGEDGDGDDGGKGMTRDEAIESAIGKLMEALDPGGTMKGFAALLNRLSEQNNDEEERDKKIKRITNVPLNISEPAFRPIASGAVYGAKFEVKADAKWKKFAEALKYATQSKHAPLIPSAENGRVVSSRLSRIITDNKILGLGRDKRQRGIPEIILLVDLSGSMSTRRTFGDQTRSLVDYATNAAWGLFSALSEVRIPVAVYGHTSTDAGNQALIYSIAAAGMPLERLEIPRHTSRPHEAFVNCGKVHLIVNYDGVAIDFVSKRFTSKPGTKLLIVISDGEPSGDGGYDGNNAEDHTIFMIAKARDRGVKVIAMSIVPSVVEDNDRIYGKEYNVDATKNLSEEMRKVINSLLERG